MLYDVLEVGDEVVIDISRESRLSGYNPRPNGARAKVVGFSKIAHSRVNNFGRKPGYYVNKTWATIRDDLGEFEICSVHLALADQEDYFSRVASWREQHKESYFDPAAFVGELPDTPFWEGDIVRYKQVRVGLATEASVSPLAAPEINTFVIVRIAYDRLGEQSTDGNPYPAYDISYSFEADWHKPASINELTLIERGNVWKYYHQEPLCFSNWLEEASFFLLVGETDEVRNPASRDYSWSKQVALTAIRQGIGDAITNGTNKLCLYWPPYISVVKYHDRELGRRVAARSLEYFDTTS